MTGPISRDICNHFPESKALTSRTQFAGILPAVLHGLRALASQELAPFAVGVQCLSLPITPFPSLTNPLSLAGDIPDKSFRALSYCQTGSVRGSWEIIP